MVHSGFYPGLVTGCKSDFALLLSDLYGTDRSAGEQNLPLPLSNYFSKRNLPLRLETTYSNHSAVNQNN